MVKISLFRRHAVVPTVVQPTEEDIRRMVYELVRERMLHALGTSGSFSITMRRGDSDDAFFSETFAESMAWDVALRVPTRSIAAATVSAAAAPALTAPAAVPAARTIPAEVVPISSRMIA